MATTNEVSVSQMITDLTKHYGTTEALQCEIRECRRGRHIPKVYAVAELWAKTRPSNVIDLSVQRALRGR